MLLCFFLGRRFLLGLGGEDSIPSSQGILET